MDSRDQPEEAVICLFEGGFTGQSFSSFDFDETTTLGIPLFD
jgi:hypothetical protein